MHFEHALESQQGFGFDFRLDPDRFDIFEILEAVCQVIESSTVHIGAGRTGLPGQLENLLVGIFVGQTMNQIYFRPDSDNRSGRLFLDVLHNKAG